MSEPVDRFVERGAGECEAQQNLARLALGLHLRVERAEEARISLVCRAKANALADLEFLGGAHQRLPAARIDPLDQSRCDAGDRIAAHAHAVEARGDDTGISDDDRIVRLQIVRQIADARIDQRAAGADDEQARRFARRNRLQRDALRRQIKIEEIDAHQTVLPAYVVAFAPP